LIIECKNCHARYQYDEDRFERKPSKKIKCARCSTVFEIHNPAYTAKKTSQETDIGEMTSVKRPEPKQPDPLRESTPPAPAPAVEKHPPPKASPPQLPAGKRLSLAVINGPDAGNVFRIEKPRTTLGRSGADITLNDTEASRVHAAVEIRDTSYLVEDLQSTNGTIVDGQKINGPTELQNHSEFQVGDSTLMLIVTEEV